MNIQAQSWQDLQVAQPIDPRTVLLTATLGSTVGTFTRSVASLQSSWTGTNPIVFTGSNTKLVSLDTTDAATTLEALQWTASHQMVNSAAPAGLNVAFGKAGAIFDNQYELSFG